MNTDTCTISELDAILESQMREFIDDTLLPIIYEQEIAHVTKGEQPGGKFGGGEKLHLPIYSGAHVEDFQHDDVAARIKFWRKLDDICQSHIDPLNFPHDCESELAYWFREKIVSAIAYHFNCNTTRESLQFFAFLGEECSTHAVQLNPRRIVRTALNLLNGSPQGEEFKEKLATGIIARKQAKSRKLQPAAQ